MKPTVKLKNWRLTEGIVQGDYADPRWSGFVTAHVIGIAKESEDVLIIETEYSYFILEPVRTI